MADSTAVPTVTRVWKNGNVLEVIGTVAIGASPATYATGGIVMSFAVAGIQSAVAPLYVDVKGIAGFKYEFSAGTTNANGLLLIRVENTVGTNTPLAQHSVAAIVSGVSGDTITFRALFPWGK